MLTRGVGLHNVMGITVDIAVGTYLDRVSHTLSSQLNQVQDKQMIAKFLSEENTELSEA